jgi:hypothetical protein
MDRIEVHDPTILAAARQLLDNCTSPKEITASLCPKCRADNPPDKRFCSDCGATLSAEVPRVFRPSQFAATELHAVDRSAILETELAIVIARRALRLPQSEARRYVLGYTCMNDVTAVDLQNRDREFTRGNNRNRDKGHRRDFTLK